ncbi:MAG: calcium/sodium antiporter [Bacilli bacterium]|nr:calcium/sodium antiporter [Bacilli bacterium]
MAIVVDILLLLVGFVLLVKASDIFVDAVSSIATNFKMSKMMIALTVAAFGTCAPELAISFNSMSSGSGDIALANVLGSNIVNILLIVGIAALVKPINVKHEVIKKELPILLVVTSMFTLSILAHELSFTNDFILNSQDGILFICLFLMFMFYIVSVVKSKQGVFEHEKAKYSLIKSILLTIVCCVVIILSSDLVVDSAESLATALNVSTKLITMTVVVIGTSLPEMTMTVIAAKKGEFDIALGNIIGTNIFNIGVVLGLPLLVYGGFRSFQFSMIDVLVVQLAAFVLFMFARNDKVLSKVEGIVMISIFAIYYLYIFIF